MVVLLTYHKLVERDSKNVDIHWKASSIVLLVISIFCSLAVSLSLQQLTSAFDDRCILGAQLTLETSTKSIKQNETESSTLPVTRKSSLIALSEIFNKTYADFIVGTDKILEFPVDQAISLRDKQINEKTSVWGNKNRCDFSIYTPIGQCCFAIIVMTMFVICGKGGKADENSFLTEPWRIVTPALGFFVVMIALSFANLLVIEGGLNTFCNSFKENLPDIGCTYAMNRYMEKPITISPGTVRIILTFFNYFTFFCWLISALVLVARIIFVIDFQLVRVTVKSMEHESATEKSSFKVVESEESPEGIQGTSQC